MKLWITIVSTGLLVGCASVPAGEDSIESARTELEAGRFQLARETIQKFPGTELRHQSGPRPLAKSVMLDYIAFVETEFSHRTATCGASPKSSREAERTADCLDALRKRAFPDEVHSNPRFNLCDEERTSWQCQPLGAHLDSVFAKYVEVQRSKMKSLSAALYEVESKENSAKHSETLRKQAEFDSSPEGLHERTCNLHSWISENRRIVDEETKLRETVGVFNKTRLYEASRLLATLAPGLERNTKEYQKRIGKQWKPESCK